MQCVLRFFFFCNYLREGVSRIGSSSGKRGEEGGSTCVDHLLLQLQLL